MSPSTIHYINGDFNTDSEWVGYERGSGNFSSGLPSGYTHLTFLLVLEIYKNK